MSDPLVHQHDALVPERSRGFDQSADLREDGKVLVLHAIGHVHVLWVDDHKVCLSFLDHGETLHSVTGLNALDAGRVLVAGGRGLLHQCHTGIVVDLGHAQLNWKGEGERIRDLYRMSEYLLHSQTNNAKGRIMVPQDARKDCGHRFCYPPFIAGSLATGLHRISVMITVNEEEDEVLNEFSG